MTQSSTTTGGCLCGAVRFELADTPTEYGACHCQMCRKFGGGIELGLMVQPDRISWTKDTELKTYASSAWAERGFCNTCGSSLFWRLTAPSPQKGILSLSVGALDSMDGLAFTSEVYIDHKPSTYAFAGTDRKQMTEAEIMEMVAEGGQGDDDG